VTSYDTMPTSIDVDELPDHKHISILPLDHPPRVNSSLDWMLDYARQGHNLAVSLAKIVNHTTVQIWYTA
jgi:hypothetical protein